MSLFQLVSFYDWSALNFEPRLLYLFMCDKTDSYVFCHLDGHCLQRCNSYDPTFDSFSFTIIVHPFLLLSLDSFHAINSY